MAPGRSLEEIEAAEEADRALMRAHGRKLIRVAVSAVVAGLRNGKPPRILMKSVPEILRAQRASFVTLTQQGRLRGCVGSLEATRPLALDVAYNAYSAAFRDPRFPPLEPKEANRVGVSLSLLSEAIDIEMFDQDDLLSQLRPGIDGLIIHDPGPGGGRAVFLPQVWEDIPDPVEFLTRLRLKAGMAGDHWSDALTAKRFTVQKSPPLGYERADGAEPRDAAPAVASAS